MRCPHTDFRCCAVFSAGSNPDFDLCATVRDFHPCFPRPTDWLKCKKERFEKFRTFQERSSLADWCDCWKASSYSNMSICCVNSKKLHCRMFLEGIASLRAWTLEMSSRNSSDCSFNETAHPCRFASQTPPVQSLGKKCRLGIAVQAVSSALFANPLVFFSSKDLARGLLHLLVQ